MGFSFSFGFFKIFFILQGLLLLLLLFFLLQTAFFFFLSFVYLFLAVLGLHCSAGFSLVVASGGYSLVAVCGLLIAVASLIAEHGL